MLFSWMFFSKGHARTTLTAPRNECKLTPSCGPGIRHPQNVAMSASCGDYWQHTSHGIGCHLAAFAHAIERWVADPWLCEGREGRREMLSKLRSYILSWVHPIFHVL